MKNSIKVPMLVGKEWKQEEHSYDELLESYKKSINNLPEMISALKNADNEKWGQLFKDLALHMSNDKELSKVIRPAMKNGENGISVGEPNWFFVPLMLSFAAGYAVGTACYKAGPCKV